MGIIKYQHTYYTHFIFQDECALLRSAEHHRVALF